MPRTPCHRERTRWARTPHCEARWRASRPAPHHRQPPEPDYAALHSWLFQTLVPLRSVRFGHRQLGEQTRDDLVLLRLCDVILCTIKNQLHSIDTMLPLVSAGIASAGESASERGRQGIGLVELRVLRPRREERDLALLPPQHRTPQL